MIMKKWLALLIAFVASAAIIAFSVISTVSSFDIGGIAAKLENAFKDDGDQAESKKYVLDVSATEGGSVNTAGGEFENGATVMLTATADPGYVFEGWYTNRGKYISMSQSYELLIEKSTSVQAKFQKEKTKEDEIEELNGVFETLYTEYNENSVELQKETVKSVITGNVDALSSSSVANTKIVDLYVDTLFNSIDENRKEDADLSKTEEFSKTESLAYDSLMNVVDGVVNEKENYNPEEAELTQSVENIIKSDVCKQVIQGSIDDGDISKNTQASGDKLNDQAKETLEKSIQSVYDSSVDEEDKTTLSNLADLFGITLK